MKSNVYTNLEEDFHIKKAYLKKTPWWKSLLFVGPVALLFIGLFGVLYLQQGGLLLSWYAVPYIVIFAVGTIWLKAVRLHLVRTAVKNPDSFLACAAQEIGVKGGYVYVIFMTNFRKHDPKYMATLSQEIDAETIMNENLKKARKHAIKLSHKEGNIEYYLRAFYKGSLNKTNSDWEKDHSFPVFFINEKYTFPIKGRHIFECGG